MLPATRRRPPAAGGPHLHRRRRRGVHQHLLPALRKPPAAQVCEAVRGLTPRVRLVAGAGRGVEAEHLQWRVADRSVTATGGQQLPPQLACQRLKPCYSPSKELVFKTCLTTIRAQQGPHDSPPRARQSRCPSHTAADCRRSPPQRRKRRRCPVGRSHTGVSKAAPCRLRSGPKLHAHATLQRVQRWWATAVHTKLLQQSPAGKQPTTISSLSSRHLERLVPGRQRRDELLQRGLIRHHSVGLVTRRLALLGRVVDLGLGAGWALSAYCNVELL